MSKENEPLGQHENGNDYIADVRRSALEWWNSIKGNQYPMIVKHANIISGGANRHPTTLSGSEIESMYRLEHYA